MILKYGLSNLTNIAQALIDNIGERKIFAFYGEMGAGKTTLIAEICRLLGVEEAVNSPTFAIVNEYETLDKKIIYHFDCYRLQSAEDGLNIGATDYFYSGNICFIEWAENITSIIPEETVEVRITVLEENTRQIEF